MTSVAMFIHWASLFYAPINLIAPLEGVGLIALAIFSYFVLHEEITNLEKFGTVMIIFGVVLIAAFNQAQPDITLGDFDRSLFFWLLLLVNLPLLAATFVSKQYGYKYAGLIIGTLSGTMMGFQTVTKRLTAVEDLFFAYTAATFILAALTLGFTQYALAKAKANRVIPCATGSSIIVATVVEVLALSENIILIQMIGMALVVFGAILLTIEQKDPELAPTAPPILPETEDTVEKEAQN